MAIFLYGLGSIALIVVLIGMLWALRVLPIVKICGRFLKEYRVKGMFANDQVRYRIEDKMRYLHLATDDKNREELIYSSVTGSFLQLSNHMNVPVSIHFRGTKVLSLYKGCLGVWLRSFKREPPLTEYTYATIYQGNESALRKLPVDHPLRTDLEKELRSSVRNSVELAREGDVSAASLLWRALLARPSQTHWSFAMFHARRGILIGTKECYVIGTAICKEMGFTVDEAEKLLSKSAERTPEPKPAH